MRILKEKRVYYPLSVFIVALTVRLLVAWQGMEGSEEIFYRPDTPGYLNPGKALIEDLEYNISSGSPHKEVGRPPLTSLFLQLIMILGSVSLPPFIILCVIFSFIPLLIYHIALLLKLSVKIALFAGLLSALNITLIAHSPLYLSDSLFSLTITLILYLLIRAIQSASSFMLFATALSWGISTLIRPVSILLAGLMLIIVFFSPLQNRYRKIFVVFIFAAALIPASWLYRNYNLGAGMNLGTKVSDHIFNITAIVESGETGANISELKNILVSKAHEKCKDLKNEVYQGCMVKNAKKNLRVSFKKYPVAYLKKFFLNYYVLLPDLPTLCQLLGLSERGKGTLHVLQKEGILKAVKFYFSGKIYLIYIFSPLIILYFLITAASFLEFFCRIKEKDVFFCSLFISFVIYFLLQGGAVTVPRYQLPALPMIYLSAGFFMKRLNKKGDHFES